MNLEAQRAAIGGTREMMREDEFNALVSALVAANAVPKPMMATVLENLADGLIAKARGDMETDFMIYPAELLCRARSLGEAAARLRR